MLSYLKSVLVVLGATAAASAQGSGNVVNLGYAQYQGVFNNATNITSFLGVRYAAPPTGSLRWQVPQPPANVSGVQQANTLPNVCFQGSTGAAPNTPFGQHSVVGKRAASVVQNEDCLFLSVFVSGNVTPRAALPVVVWIHGGGYVGGSAPADGGDLIRDARGGVISVVIQYRLGVFGFLPGAEVKANGALNTGLLDQNFALQWVRNHIVSFGGDPSKVTIWGESAGAGSVLQHVVAHGGNTDPPLFRAAMTSSTFLPSQYNYDDEVPEKIYTTVVTRTNCATSRDTLSCLRAVDAGSLEAANANISLSGFSGTFVFVPVVDGEFIVERPVDTLRKGNVNGNALLAVTNSFEGRAFVSSSTTSNLPTYVANLFPNFGTAQINATVAQYTGVAGLTTTLDQAIGIMGESIFICPSYFLLEAFGNTGFKGEFAIPPANHGDDIGEYFPSTRAPVTANTTFIASFSQSFLAVVKSLDPNAKFNSADSTPRWAAWSSANTEMLFNVSLTDQAVIHPIITDPGLISRCNFWKNVSSFTPQ